VNDAVEKIEFLGGQRQIEKRRYLAPFRIMVVADVDGTRTAGLKVRGCEAIDRRDGDGDPAAISDQAGFFFG